MEVSSRLSSPDLWICGAWGLHSCRIESGYGTNGLSFASSQIRALMRDVSAHLHAASCLDVSTPRAGWIQPLAPLSLATELKSTPYLSPNESLATISIAFAEICCDLIATLLPYRCEIPRYGERGKLMVTMQETNQKACRDRKPPHHVNSFLPRPSTFLTFIELP